MFERSSSAVGASKLVGVFPSWGVVRVNMVVFEVFEVGDSGLVDVVPGRSLVVVVVGSLSSVAAEGV